MNPFSFALRHPETIHPALWRGSQLAHAPGATLSTGFRQLDTQLPGLGWPLGTLTELLPSRSGIGEIHLMGPAFRKLAPERRIALVQPPYVPSAQCWSNWQLDTRRLLWVQPKPGPDTLWVCEQILKHNACAALLCWASSAHPASLRRLHLAARQSETLFILLRPQAALSHYSPAPLRLALKPSSQGLEVIIAKRQGPPCDQPVLIALHPNASTPYTQNASLDRHSPAHAQPGYALSPMAH